MDNSDIVKESGMTLRQLLGFPVEEITEFCRALPAGDPMAQDVCRLAGAADEFGWDAPVTVLAEYAS